LLAIVNNKINSVCKPLLTRYGRKRCDQSDEVYGDITLRVMHHEASDRPIKSSKSSTTVTVSRRSNRTRRAPTNANGTIAQSYSAYTTGAARHSTGSSSTHKSTAIRSSGRLTKAPVNADGTIAQRKMACAVTRSPRQSSNAPDKADGIIIRSYSVSTVVA
jgi:hypothetical protein